MKMLITAFAALLPFAQPGLSVPPATPPSGQSEVTITLVRWPFT